MSEERDARKKDAKRQTLHARLALKRDKARTCVSGVWRLASLACIAAACASNPAGTTTTVTSSTVPTTTGVRTTWLWGIDDVDLGGGYSLGPCEGDADQIACITKDDAVIGSAEFLTLSAESFEILDGVDDPVESVELLAADHVSIFAADRQSTCPNLEFKALAPLAVTIGGLPGLRYGFEELEGSRTVEQNVIYGVREEASINLFNFSAVADGACLSNEGELSDPAILGDLLPGLDGVMAFVESG